MAVLFAFPVFMAGVIILKGVLLFRRDLVRDKEVRQQAPWQPCRTADIDDFPDLATPWRMQPQLYLTVSCVHVLQKFNSWLDEEIQQSLLNAMLVYPEGVAIGPTSATWAHVRRARCFAGRCLGTLRHLPH